MPMDALFHDRLHFWTDESLTPFERMDAFNAPLSEYVSPDLPEVRDLAIDGVAGDIPVRLYVPIGAGPGSASHPRPCLIWYHGGGFEFGGLDQNESDVVSREIAARGDVIVIAVDYRLAPEHPFPAAPDDCEAAARWLAASPAELGRTVTGLVTIGGSAGGIFVGLFVRAITRLRFLFRFLFVALGAFTQNGPQSPQGPKGGDPC